MGKRIAAVAIGLIIGGMAANAYIWITVNRAALQYDIMERREVEA